MRLEMSLPIHLFGFANDVREALERSAGPHARGLVEVLSGSDALDALCERAPHALLLLPQDALARLPSITTPRLQLVPCLSREQGPPPTGPWESHVVEELSLPADPGSFARLRRRATVRAARYEDARAPSPAYRNRAHETARGPAARRLLEQIERLAGAPDTTVLLSGPAGSGKQSIARAIHQRSPRADAPFCCFHVTSAGDPEPTQALFGDALLPGGLIDAPHGGSLYLGSVERLPRDCQERLSRRLTERAARPQDAYPRLFAGSARDLESEVAAKRFDEELLYRLNVLSLRIPALCECPEDLSELARRELATRPSVETGDPATLTPSAQEELEQHPWPGNHRELAAALERAVLAAEGGRILPHHLRLARPESLESDAEGRDLLLPVGDRSLKGAEEMLIRRVLAEEKGNRSRVARILGINRTTLYNKLKQYRIESEG